MWAGSILKDVNKRAKLINEYCLHIFCLSCLPIISRKKVLDCILTCQKTFEVRRLIKFSLHRSAIPVLIIQHCMMVYVAWRKHIGSVFPFRNLARKAIGAKFLHKHNLRTNRPLNFGPTLRQTLWNNPAGNFLIRTTNQQHYKRKENGNNQYFFHFNPFQKWHRNA